MKTSAAMIGKEFSDSGIRLNGWASSAAAPVLGRLRAKGFIMFLPELKAWRLTAQGREYVKTQPGVGK